MVRPLNGCNSRVLFDVSNVRRMLVEDFGQGESGLQYRGAVFAINHLPDHLIGLARVDGHCLSFGINHPNFDRPSAK